MHGGDVALDAVDSCSRVTTSCFDGGFVKREEVRWDLVGDEQVHEVLGQLDFLRKGVFWQVEDLTRRRERRG